MQEKSFLLTFVSLLHKFIPSQQTVHTVWLSWIYARTYLLHSWQQKWKKELNKQVERQIFDSYPSKLSNVFLPRGTQVGNGAAYPAVDRPFKKSFRFSWSYLHYLRQWLRSLTRRGVLLTAFLAKLNLKCDLKGKPHRTTLDFYEKNRKTKSSGNSALNKPYISVPNSCVNKSWSFHCCLGKRKGRLKAGEAWGEP